MELFPINDQVLLRLKEAEGRTKGGIILPENVKEKPKQGVVVAVGSGKMLPNGTRVEPRVVAGDAVVFSSYAGTPIKVGGVDHLLIREEDILAKIKE